MCVVVAYVTKSRYLVKNISSHMYSAQLEVFFLFSIKMYVVDIQNKRLIEMVPFYSIFLRSYNFLISHLVLIIIAFKCAF